MERDERKTEMLERVADHIERLERPTDLTQGFEQGFAMNTYVSGKRDYADNYCGTVACIAGWGRLLHQEEDLRIRNNYESSRENYVKNRGFTFGHMLDLDLGETVALFMPDGYSDRTRFTPRRAAAVLRNLAKTGKVEWEKFDDEGQCVLRPKEA